MSIDEVRQVFLDTRDPGGDRLIALISLTIRDRELRRDVSDFPDQGHFVVAILDFGHFHLDRITHFMRNGFRLELFSCRERRTLADHPQCILVQSGRQATKDVPVGRCEPATSDLDVLVKRVSSLLPRRFTTCDGADDVSERNGFETFHDAFERMIPLRRDYRRRVRIREE